MLLGIEIEERDPGGSEYVMAGEKTLRDVVGGDGVPESESRNVCQDCWSPHGLTGYVEELGLGADCDGSLGRSSGFAGVILSTLAEGYVGNLEARCWFGERCWCCSTCKWRETCRAGSNIPMGILTFDRSQTPSSRSLMALAASPRLARTSVMESAVLVGAAKMVAGARASMTEIVLMKIIVPE